ncbi:hypothetical protein [Deminuibacter soli]|nr:hypothetical protein [Deminuibacter soli]
MKQTSQKRTLLFTIAVAGIAIGLTAAVLKKKKKKSLFTLDEHEHAMGGY